MRSWKRKTRAQHKAKYHAWYERETEHRHKSRWAASRWKGTPHWNDVQATFYQPWGLKIWRNGYFFDLKKDIRDTNAALRKFAEFPYIEDCRYHPCRVTNIDTDASMRRIDFDCESLVNGSPNSCSYFNCGVVHLTKEDGEERALFINLYGMLSYMINYIYGPMTKEQMEATIRYDLAMEKAWNFSGGGQVAHMTDQGKEWLLDKYGIVFDDLTPMSEEEL